MIDPTNAATIKVLNTIHMAMDEKSAKYLVEHLSNDSMVITYGSNEDQAFIEEYGNGVTLAIVWFPDCSPYGDVEVSDRLLEKMGM